MRNKPGEEIVAYLQEKCPRKLTPREKSDFLQRIGCESDDEGGGEYEGAGGEDYADQGAGGARPSIMDLVAAQPPRRVEETTASASASASASAGAPQVQRDKYTVTGARALAERTGMSLTEANLCCRRSRNGLNSCISWERKSGKPIPFDVIPPWMHDVLGAIDVPDELFFNPASSGEYHASGISLTALRGLPYMEEDQEQYMKAAEFLRKEGEPPFSAVATVQNSLWGAEAQVRAMMQGRMLKFRLYCCPFHRVGGSWNFSDHQRGEYELGLIPCPHLIQDEDGKVVMGDITNHSIKGGMTGYNKKMEEAMRDGLAVLECDCPTCATVKENERVAAGGEQNFVAKTVGR